METQSRIMIRGSNLNKKVRSGDSTISILNAASFSINAGETVAITGASGSGKTTLLTLMGGLDSPSSGELYFEDQALHLMSEEQRARLRGQAMGFVFQSFYLLPNLSALENVMLPLELQYVKPKMALERAKAWLEKVGLASRRHHYPTQLSGGEQQRVAIARAFVTQPRLILADEMTGNLDTKTGELIADLIFALNAEHKTTLVLVTHDEHLSARCQRTYVLADGLLSC